MKIFFCFPFHVQHWDKVMTAENWTWVYSYKKLTIATILFSHKATVFASTFRIAITRLTGLSGKVAEELRPGAEFPTLTIYPLWPYCLFVSLRLMGMP